jgi:hypothetical protein
MTIIDLKIDTNNNTLFIYFAVTIGCGGISRENCTFFDSPAGIGAGACAATICKNTPGICSVS